MIGSWEGQFPFLLEAFLQVGRNVGDFHAWTEIFKGDMRPVDDLPNISASNCRYRARTWRSKRCALQMI